MRTLFSVLLCCCLVGPWIHAQNLALCLDRNQEDYVRLPTIGTPLDNNPSTFTVEGWLNDRNTTINHFRRIFSFGGPNVGSGNTRFEVGVQAGQLNFFSNLTGRIVLAPVAANTWTHLAVVKTSTQIDFYLDCAIVGSIPFASSNYDFDFFYLGRWPGGIAPNADWDGFVDDVRLWSTARTSTDICDALYCPLSCNEGFLVANWTFDNDGATAAGNNSSLGQVLDCSPNANHGNLLNFPANGNCSNWVNSGAPLAFPALHNLGLEIRDYPQRTNLLTGICDGDPVHFCLDDNGQTPGPYSNVTVRWEESDDGGLNWNTVTSSAFVDFCFPVWPGEITVPCPGNNNGFVDRKYRAVTITTGPTGAQCDHISEEYDLQICCPISGANPILLPGNMFCEGESVNFTVDLNPTDIFVANPGPNVTIDWFYVDPSGRTPLPAYANQTTFSFPTWTAPFPPGGVPTQYCFEAEVRNCQGKLEVFPICWTVDPQPVCGTIEGAPIGSPQNLTLLSSNPLVYEICPGNDALLQIAAAFQYCIPQWQYSFTPGNPTSWVNMGFSGSVQNTNVLPGNSYPWPVGATSIFYRIQCNPLSNPSACDPCFGNIVEIQLKPSPALPMIIGPTQECLENAPVTLSISNIDPTLTCTWYHDGLQVGTGTSIMTSEAGCYWVEASNDCQTVQSTQHCLDICETIARISCPLPPNECANPGVDITLSACDSENTCSGNTGTTLTYEWFVNGVSQGPPSTTCTFMHTPATGGTSYSVVVTDPATGCVGTAVRDVTPCDQN